jgi:hypothetical protein
MVPDCRCVLPILIRRFKIIDICKESMGYLTPPGPTRTGTTTFLARTAER